MIRERLRSLLLRVRTFASSRERQVSPNNCIGFIDQAQVFQYSTFGDAKERERIIKELQSSGADIVGVISLEEALKRSKRPRDPFQPNNTPFRDI